MSSAAATALTLGELRHVLCHPEQFELKENVWFALDVPLPFVTALPNHCLSVRLGCEQAHLQSLLGILHRGCGRVEQRRQGGCSSRG